MEAKNDHIGMCKCVVYHQAAVLNGSPQKIALCGRAHARKHTRIVCRGRAPSAWASAPAASASGSLPARMPTIRNDTIGAVLRLKVIKSDTGCHEKQVRDCTFTVAPLSLTTACRSTGHDSLYQINMT